MYLCTDKNTIYMRRTAILIAALVFAVSAESQSFNVRTIPSPQRVERADGFYIGVPPIQNRLVSRIDGAENQSQAYRVIIDKTGLTIEYVDFAGYDYAAQFVEKLAAAWHDSLPCMTVTDWPAFEFRGFQDDISRGPIPSRSFTEKQLQLADQLRLNANSYYTEHTFYSDSMSDLSPLSARDIPTAEDHRSIFANMQCLAHFEKTLASPFYDNIKDTPASVDPSSESTYNFLHQRLGEVARANRRAKMFNINCDETEALGSGRSHRFVDSVGADAAYCRHIKRVAKILKPYGFQLLMWGDIVAKNPDMMHQLPADMTYIAWAYSPLASYDAVLKPFVDANVNFWVAASTSQSSTVAPDPAAWMVNIANLARDGHRHGAQGFMLTAWDDRGESLFGASHYIVAWAAEMAWHPIEATDPAQAEAEMRQRLEVFDQNYSRLYDRREPASYRALLRLRNNPDVGDWFEVDALYSPIFGQADTVRANRVLEATRAVALDELTPHARYAVNRITLTAQKIKLMAALKNCPDSTAVSRMSDKFMNRLLDLKREYLRLWDAECTDHWRDVVASRYDKLGREVLAAPYHVFIQAQGGVIALNPLLSAHGPIYYTLDGSKPTRGSKIYNAYIEVDRSSTIRAAMFDKWGAPTYSEQYVLVHKALGAAVKLGTNYSTYREAYNGGGNDALTDGQLGSDDDYADGHWQGYQGNDIDAALAFASATHVETVTMRFLQFSRDWILSPCEIEVYASRDGQNWKLLRTEHFTPDFRHNGPMVNTCTIRNLRLKTKYLRVVARNAGPLPQWHPSAGQPSYLFCDEIVVDDK